MPPRPERTDPRGEVASVVASLVGTALVGVRYVGFPGEDPARRDNYTPDATHFAEMDIELQCREHPGVCISWSNAMGKTGEHELDAFVGPSVLEIDGEAEWPNIQRSKDGTSYPWGAVLMNAHPTWAPRIDKTITDARIRWYDGGVWDLQLGFEEIPLYLFCWDSDVVFVSEHPRPEDPRVELTEQSFGPRRFPPTNRK